MDDRGNQSGDYVWLRYGTQLTANGRSYTIEMNIPMPIGASEEKREQLLREADAGMSQVANHVENRVAQLLQRVHPPQGKVPTPAPAVRSPTQPRPASLPAPQTGPQPLQPAPGRGGRDNTAEGAISVTLAQKEAVTVPPTRLNIASSMPSTPTTGDNNNNLSLQQFISYIRENMGLNPKQAMDLLKIKTLTGINLRDALDQLQKIAGNDSLPTPEIEQSANEIAPVAAVPVRQNSGPLSATSSRPPEMVKPSNSPLPERPKIVSEEEPLYAFDEEVEPGENHELEDDLEDFNFPREFTVQERGQARSKISNLRESRGPTQANQARLQALTNVIDTQISAEQLEELLAGVWNVTSMRKLKVDQVEALISWAKEDDFVSEVEAVLVILEEE